MSLIASTAELEYAKDHLLKNDPVLVSIIEQVGLAKLEPHHNYYQELVDSIISQQLSVHAARAIENRFRELFGGSFPTAEQILTTDVEALRAIGFSRAKGRYVLDLAQHIVDGKISFAHFDQLSNAEIITILTAVKGIGEWTVHMFLMFCMGRLDILAYGDLGVRNGIKILYKLEKIPDRQQVENIAREYHWHPYESAACWYVWQSLNNQPALALES